MGRIMETDPKLPLEGKYKAAGTKQQERDRVIECFRVPSV